MRAFRAVIKSCGQDEVCAFSGQGHGTVQSCSRWHLGLACKHTLLVKLETGYRWFAWRSIPPFHMNGAHGGRRICNSWQTADEED